MNAAPRKRWVILGAVLIAVLLVGGAWYLSGNQFSSSTLTAEATEELLDAYAAKDTDGDGLYDWQESLYGTDPANPRSFRADLTDKEAVSAGLVAPAVGTTPSGTAADLVASIPGPTAAPGSVTDKFALAFFESYVDTGGKATASPEALQQFVKGAVADLAKQRVTAPSYSTSNLTVSTSATLASYASAMGELYAAHPDPAPYSEITYFSDAVMKQDASALSMVKRVGVRYGAIREALLLVPVPQALLSQHLSLANGAAMLEVSIGDMASFDTDPVRALLGFGSYEDAARAYVTALAMLKKSYPVSPANAFGALMTEAEDALTP